MYLPRIVGVIAILIVLVGCDAPVSSLSEPESSTGEIPAGIEAVVNADPDAYDTVPVVARFDLDVAVTGSLMPGEPVRVDATVHSRLATEDAQIQFVLPQLAAVESKGTAGTPTIDLLVGQSLPASKNVRTSTAAQETREESTTLTFDEPGYYQLVVRAEAPTAEHSADGQWIDNLESQEMWILIDEKGGAVTSDFEPSRLPEGVRAVPGPRVLEGEDDRFRSIGPNGAPEAVPATPKSSTSFRILYYDQTSNANKGLQGVYAVSETYDVLGRRIARYTGRTNSNGYVSLSCPPSGYTTVKFETVDNDVNVYRGSSTVLSMSYPACGGSNTLTVNSDQGHVFDRMRKAAQRSRSYFGSSRGRLDVRISSSEGSYYQGGKDRVTMRESSIGGSFGDFVVPHEYGHAYHEKALGGNGGSGQCPSPHYFDGAHNMECAYSEGFANYLASVTLDGYNYYKSRIQSNGFYPGGEGNGDRNDGSIIEGAVAAFLYDLTDPANETHDKLDFPGRYVGDIIRTCRWEYAGWLTFRATGVDHLIMCMQRSTPNYSKYFQQRGGAVPTSYSEGASEPSGWSRDEIRRIWREDLYGETYVPPFTASISGSTYLNSGDQGTWTASVQNAPGSSVSYEWSYKVGSGSYVQTSTTSSTFQKVLYSQNSSSYTYYTIRLVARSGGVSKTAYRSVTIPPQSSCDQQQNLNEPTPIIQPCLL